MVPPDGAAPQYRCCTVTGADLGNVVTAQNTLGSNKQPFAFGADQTIIDLNKLVWEPFKAEGVPPGPELAVLRGDAKGEALEVMVRLPANYTFPNHSHTRRTVRLA